MGGGLLRGAGPVGHPLEPEPLLPEGSVCMLLLLVPILLVAAAILRLSMLQVKL